MAEKTIHTATNSINGMTVTVSGPEPFGVQALARGEKVETLVTLFNSYAQQIFDLVRFMHPANQEILAEDLDDTLSTFASKEENKERAKVLLLPYVTDKVGFTQAWEKI